MALNPSTEVIDVLPQRINHEVTLFISCTLKALACVFGVCIISLIFVGIMLAALVLPLSPFSVIALGAGVGLLAGTGLGYLLAKMLQHLKANKPAGYYSLYIRVKLEDAKLLTPKCIRASGPWSLIQEEN